MILENVVDSSALWLVLGCCAVESFITWSGSSNFRFSKQNCFAERLKRFWMERILWSIEVFPAGEILFSLLSPFSLINPFYLFHSMLAPRLSLCWHLTWTLLLASADGSSLSRILVGSYLDKIVCQRIVASAFSIHFNCKRAHFLFISSLKPTEFWEVHYEIASSASGTMSIKAVPRWDYEPFSLATICLCQRTSLKLLLTILNFLWNWVGPTCRQLSRFL